MRLLSKDVKTLQSYKTEAEAYTLGWGAASGFGAWHLSKLVAKYAVTTRPRLVRGVIGSILFVPMCYVRPLPPSTLCVHYLIE